MEENRLSESLSFSRVSGVYLPPRNSEVPERESAPRKESQSRRIRHKPSESKGRENKKLDTRFLRSSGIYIFFSFMYISGIM